MEPVFTIQYGEFAVADYLTKKIKGTSVFIPTSRQEKGIDLLLYRYLNGSSAINTIQVKMSRTYYPTKKKRPRTEQYPYYLWFNRFDPQPNADWFILVGIYAKHSKNTNARANSTKWDTIMLAFNQSEMVDFMKSVKQKKDSSIDDRMFGFGFDENKKIYQTRGCASHICMNEKLIENRIQEIINSFHP